VEVPNVAGKPSLSPAFEHPEGFRITPLPEARNVAVAAPPLGILADFTGTFVGSGFNTIFRPQNPASPTALPVPQPESDNILELNLTSEVLSFSNSLGSVPNRGRLMPDIFLNAVPYLQTISDVTDPVNPVAIHFEPGLWLAVPATTDPADVATLVRMASIPHGTTIQAQGNAPAAGPTAGKPNIPPLGITPVPIGGGAPVVFPSQTAANKTTPRLPQDLSAFIAAGTITQALLDNPNSLLTDHIAGQKIVAFAFFEVDTSSTAPLFGGGTDNIAFLLGNAAANNQNAQAVEMRAAFWVESIQETIDVPPMKAGRTVIIHGKPGIHGQKVPSFAVTAKADVYANKRIDVTWTQIQYSQLVKLNFNNLSWPHASVATLVPKDPIAVSV
jgi:hypothetical protein